MDRTSWERPGICAVCGKQFTKTSSNHKYCSQSCAISVQRAQNREWLREFYRKQRELREFRELHAENRFGKPTETIEEVAAKANAAGMTYGKYVAMIREMEGREIYGRCEVDQDNH